MNNDSFLNIILDFPINESVTQRLYFRDPLNIIACKGNEDIDNCLTQLEGEQEKGNYVVGFLSYDSGLTTYLLYFGIYKAPLVVNKYQKKHKHAKTSQWKLSQSLNEFIESINTIKNHIRNGDCYQVNYTLRAKSQLIEGDIEGLYHQLIDCQGAKYSAFIEHSDFSILSFSPELFFTWSNQYIETKPMKGTHPLISQYSLQEQIQSLQQSKKDQSENVMIVDLLRNDLSKICETGSVKTNKLFEVETYQDILQMTSTIQGTLQENIRFRDIVYALFPCGSITGAPKAKVMEIISNLESVPRGPYCGAIGYLAPNQQGLFNVAIRTIYHNKYDNSLTYGVGSGITWDSEATNEYKEINNKIHFLHQEPPYSLFETVNLIHGKCVFWDYHFERLKKSANELNFFPPNQTHYLSINELYEQTKLGSYRARFIYHKNGIARWEIYELPVTPITPKVQLASSPISSNDFRIRHKTTDRSVYDELFTQNKDVFFDLILWNERGEITEFTKGNIVLEIDGQLLTPSSESGLLPGILRQVLLENSLIKEKILFKEDLLVAKKIWFINSLRGWIDLDLA
ncbi:aminodeoxychorismate synthase component I [Ferrovum sp. PN-J185]|uniref:aminodeoxychorismate synthase component I n=1 Tax=Ferrovum sp. PN-J185 TaxID=1356306 RepID=UPI0007955563|nr:aminodeoxychorismate synthase component I [Ferrovum sp. PN-J185]KXW56916.1 aminodeoxychorismate synthase component 1 [Ferrovum sp. PN-J185]MCC6069208.1 aminodeoxychorismate synthase component I [Ferrovum sp. PN-J185]